MANVFETQVELEGHFLPVLLGYVRPEAMLVANPASTKRFTKAHPECANLKS